MKQSLRLIIFALLGLSCFPQTFATTIDFEAPIIAFNSDKKYKFEVIPPKFKNRISYGFFQADDFMHLTLSEGAGIAKAAVVTANLYQNQKGTYVLIWSRPLVSPIIPTRAFVLGSGTDIVAIVDGKRNEAPPSDNKTPYSLYRFNGSCLTNGLYLRSKTNSWSLNSTIVTLQNEEGHTMLEAKL